MQSHSSQMVVDHRHENEPWSSDQNRGKRVVMFALLLAVLNWYDLVKTIEAFQAGVLYEANPLAAMILESYGSVGISFFKAFLVSSAMIALVLGREFRVAEVGSLATNLVYLVVACLWLMYPSELL